MTVDAGHDDGTHRTGAGAPVLHPGDPREAGRVRLLGRLGEGGMGVVFLGEQPGGRLVAVKVIRDGFARDRRFLARFAAEATAARRVARFCTAQVLDAGTDGGVAYLVTEYIEGPTLADAVVQDGPLRGSSLDSLAIGIAAALNGIHAAGVVHRDLKPSNVLLSRVGPKVIDFGIARALDDVAGLTESGHLVGTPAYMPPEQFQGAATTATDVFCWGAVVTFAATGRPPFGTGAPYQLMHRVLTDPPDLGVLERPLRDLVARALAKEPAHRPTARDLLLELVGDVSDPIDASSRILSTRWAPPPTRYETPPTGAGTGPTRAGAAPTRLDGGDAAGPLLDRPLVERAPVGRSRRIRLLAGLGVLLAVLLAAASLRGWWPDGSAADPSGSASATPTAGWATSPGPGSSASTGTVAATTSPAADPTPGSGDVVVIALGERVPASGTVRLGVGETRPHRLHLDTARQVYLTGHVCAHLVPWRLSHTGGGVVGSGMLGCAQVPPLSLRAGDYDLLLGGQGVDGEYALTVTAR